MKKLLNYQLSTVWPSFLAIIACYTVLFILGGFTLVVSNGSSEMQVNGMETTAVIVCFSVFVAGYGENMRFAIQSGSTRIKIFQVSLINLIICSACLSVIAQIAILINGIISGQEGNIFLSLTSMLYQTDQGLTVAICESFVFIFAVLMAAGMAGIFLAAAFAGLGKYGRVLLAAGVPFFGFVLFPVIITVLLVKAPIFMQKVFELLTKIMGFESGNPYIGSLAVMIVAAVFGILAYLINRKMEIK